MERLSLAAHTLFADLLQKSMDATFNMQFPENGSFSQVKRNGRAYWYYLGYQTGGGDNGRPKKWTKYVGPVDDPEITKRVEDFKAIRENFRERRQVVTALTGMGLPRPDPLTGDLTELLWKAGIFRLRAVLVGTVAFQTYAGLLGVRLPSAQIMTGDFDIAQFHSICLLVEDSIPPILETLRQLDASFREVPHQSDSRFSSAFVNARGYRLEFLTPNTSKAEYSDKPAIMPALGGAAAQPLRFMDFLIHQPVRSVLLHKGGIPVLVPAPERYAIHKLIVSADRREDGSVKARKDAEQAGLLIEALDLNSQSLDTGFAWIEAWERGSGWQRRLIAGRDRLGKEQAALLRKAVEAAAREENKPLGDVGFGRV
ncbi:GSU2403 family nucleotidyltransferase fold protein [Brucella sp. IR073]|uniref:nucleotidyltransferase family protein n=1 Tax=unclassified Brucella TaxID=2632610 RepID=UPI003B98003A